MNEDGQFNYRTSCDTANDDKGGRKRMKGLDEDMNPGCLVRVLCFPNRSALLLNQQVVIETTRLINK